MLRTAGPIARDHGLRDPAGVMRRLTVMLLGAVVLGGCQSPRESEAPAPQALRTEGQPLGAAIETLGIT